MVLRRFGWLPAALCVVASALAQHPSEVLKSQTDAIERLRMRQPDVRFLGEGTGMERVYGPAFGGGATPEDAFTGFMAAYSHLFAGGMTRFEYKGEQSLLYGAMMTGTFDQYYGDIPVDQGRVTLLCRTQIGNPIVLAVNSAKTISQPISGPRISAQAAVTSLKKHHPTLREFEAPKLVIWMGETKPHLAWTFIASSPTSATGCTDCGSLPERVEAFVDAHTGKVLEERQAIWSVDMNGSVTGWASPGLKPDQTNNPETQQPLHNLRVNITGSSFAFTNASGSFTIPHGGSTAVTVNAPLTGRWVNVVNSAGATSSLSQSATPPGPVNFIFNAAKDQFTTAQVNGYIQTNLIHNFVKSVNPAYPGIDIQLPCNVNVAGSCNAFYNGSSINFYQAAAGGGTPCPNMCYSTVVWHEYGHFVIHRGGTSQGQYGEGMSDTIANLCGDTPWLGEDFRGQGTGPLRSAINNITWPTAAEVHVGGQIVSGAFWGTLQRLDATLGHATALNHVRQLAINSILLHPPGVTPGLTVDVLTLDDNDTDITNGTPHYNEIAGGFGAKNLVAPPIQFVKIESQIAPAPLVHPNDATRPLVFQVEVLPHAGEVNPNEVKLHVRENGGVWRVYKMLRRSDTLYRTQIVPPRRGSQAEWYISTLDQQNRPTNFPLLAPAELNTFMVATALETLIEDLMNTGAGWTVANTSLTAGAWAVGDPNGTSLNGYQVNPTLDSADSGVSCLFTGQGTPGGDVGEADVDGGPTTVTSPGYDLGTSDALIEYKRWFFNDDFDSDAMVAEISGDNGATWVVLETVTGIQNSWVQRSFRLKRFVVPTGPVRLRFRVADNPNNSVTEAAIDHLVIRRIVP